MKSSTKIQLLSLVIKFARILRNAKSQAKFIAQLKSSLLREMTNSRDDLGHAIRLLIAAQAIKVEEP